MQSGSHRVIEIVRYGGREALQTRERASEPLGSGQVRIAVKAIGLNFADVICRLGLYGQAPPPPFIPGFEVAGTVAELGEDVTHLALGQRVMAGLHFGGYAEEVVVRADYAHPIPEDLSFEEAAAFPVVYLTAYHALHTLGQLRGGMTVLIHAAAGGVGLAAVQMCHMKDVTVIGTAGSPEKLELLRREGVHHAINYRTEDFEAATRAIVGKRGVDLILDSIGDETTRKNDRLLAVAGHLVIFGAAALVPTGNRRNWPKLAWQWLRTPRWNALDIIPANKTVSGFHMLLVLPEDRLVLPAYAQLATWLAEGKLRPLVGRTFPFDQAYEAQEYLHQRRSVGKVVLTV